MRPIGEKRSTRLLYLVILCLPFLLMVMALLMGAYEISVTDVARVLLSPIKPDLADDIPTITQRLLLNVRLPRVLACCLSIASRFC